MNETQVKELVRIKLESEGVIFGRYYGDSLIHVGGPLVKEFFKPYNDGNYTVQVFTLPNRFFKTELNQEAVNQYLQG